MENEEQNKLEHVAESNKQAEEQQRATGQNPSGEGNADSVFGNSPRVVSHSSGECLEDVGDLQENREADPKAVQHAQNPQEIVNRDKNVTNPGGEFIDNTGDDKKVMKGDADAATG